MAALRTAASPRLTSVSSRWVLIVREPERLNRLLRSVASASRSLGLYHDHLSLARLDESVLNSVPIWTDDYTDLWSILR